MIPDEHKTNIVTNGIQFIRAITEAYGSEQGMVLWEQIASVLDPDVKGQIFFAMVTGGYNNQILLRGYYMGSNKVTMIKTIRAVDKRNLGLREAKDIVDAMEGSGRHQIIEVEHETYLYSCRELRNAGFII